VPSRTWPLMGTSADSVGDLGAASVAAMDVAVPPPLRKEATQLSPAMPYWARRCMATVRMCTSSGNRLSAPNGSTVVCRLCTAAPQDEQ